MINKSDFISTAAISLYIDTTTLLQTTIKSMDQCPYRLRSSKNYSTFHFVGAIDLCPELYLHVVDPSNSLFTMILVDCYLACVVCYLAFEQRVIK